MKAITGEVTSSNPISLSKAAGVLSRFAASETGARPDVAAYLRRAATAFNELVSVHREIRARRKVSHAEEKDGAPQEEDTSRWTKKKKGRCYEGEDRTENSILEPQWERGGSSKKKVENMGALLDERMASATVEANGVAELKKKEKRSSVGTVIESNGVVEKKKEKKKDKKKEVKEESIVEMKSQELEGDGKRSEERIYWKENKRKESQLQEGDGVGLVSESINSESKKRKHSDAEQGELDREVEQQKGKRKKKRRTNE